MSEQTTSMQALAARSGPTEIEIMPTSNEVAGQFGLEAARTRAEIDQQITSAKAYPRNFTAVANRINSLVMLDEETAAECVYALPRGGKAIRGPSIRFAEILASQWGNSRQGSRIVHIDRVDKIVVVEAVFHDLESNSATTKRVSRKISDKNGRLFNDDMIVMACNAAQSIALRNAILGGIPKAVWRQAFFAAEQVIAGDVTTLVESRDKTIKAFHAWGVTPEQICAYLEIAGPDEITLDHITTLRAAYSSIKSGEAQVEDYFTGAKPEPKKISGDLDEKISKTADKKPAEQADAPAKQTAESEKKAEPEIRESALAKDKESHSETKAAAGNASGPVDDGKAPEALTKEASGDQTPVDIARSRGIKAAEAGTSRRAVPPEYREDGKEDLRAAWWAGFDDQKDGGAAQ